jgi:hypothetical protein
MPVVLRFAAQRIIACEFEHSRKGKSPAHTLISEPWHEEMKGLRFQV